MKICMIGTGYVGLVSGVCFSDLGNEVICVDRDINKIQEVLPHRYPFLLIDRIVSKAFDSHKHARSLKSDVLVTGEHLFQHPGAWEGVVGLWLIVTRIIWCCWCIKYVFLPYKRGEVQRGNIVNGNIESTPSNDIKDMRATMKLLDWVCLLVSIFLVK